MRKVNVKALASILLTLAACASKDAPAPAPTRAAIDVTPVVAIVPVTTATPLDRYERIVRNVEGCELEGYQVDPACPGLHELTAGLADVPRTARAELGRALLGDPSPAVRIEAAELMNVHHGVGPSAADQTAIAAAAGRERDPGVLRAFIHILAERGASDPEVAKVLLAAADHADRDVRMQAVYALTSPNNRGLAGAPAKLAQLAEHDPDIEVRTTACEYAGRLGSDELIPVYKRLTATTDDPDLYAACMEGLVRMFHDHPAFETASEPAYRLFLDRLSATPRTESSPPWNVMSTFCYFSHESDLTKLAAWKQRATWFDAAEVKRVMSSVIADPHASWMARSAAVESMVGLGATRTELEALRKLVDPKSKPVLDKIAGAMAE